MAQISLNIPLELFSQQSLTGFSGAVAASTTYVGSVATVSITNNSMNVGIIPDNSIMVGCAERHEVQIQAKFTGSPAAVNVATGNADLFELRDPYTDRAVKNQFVILNPGEGLQVRIYNRAPAGNTTMSITVPLYYIDKRIWDRFIATERVKFEMV